MKKQVPAPFVNSPASRPGFRAAAGFTLALGASAALLMGGAFWQGVVDAATNWDTVVTPVAASYLSLRTAPPFADNRGLVTVGPAGIIPTPATSSDFGDWEARYNYYPTSQQ